MLVVCLGDQKRIMGQLRPSLHLETQSKEVASKSRGVDGDEVSLQALLLPGRHRASVLRTEPVLLRILLSTLLGDKKQNATDRFMRDTIRCCHGTERFFHLYHTMHHGRPLGSWNTVCRVFWPRSAFANHRRRTGIMCIIVSEQVLDLEIQLANRSKEEV